MYMTKVYLENIRGFDRLEIDFRKEGSDSVRMRTVCVGKNGTCKTTLLRAISIGLCSKADTSGLVAEDYGTLVGDSESDATIEITLSQSRNGSGRSGTIRTVIRSEKGVESLKKKEGVISKNLFVCSYGIGRGIARGSEERFREYRIADSVFTLWAYDEPLIGTEITLRRLKDFLGTKRYQHTMTQIKKAIGLSEEDEIEIVKGGGVEVWGPTVGLRIPLGSLADGYKITFNWILDFYAWAMRARGGTISGEIDGILLIDELEQHLHPSLQTEMLNSLSTLFPEVQILATTHSPLIALGAQPEELVVLKRDGRLVHRETPPDFRGYSAEDMLVDKRLFDTNVYSPEMNDKVARYGELCEIQKSKRSVSQQSELRLLANELAAQQIPILEGHPLAEELRKFREKFDL